MVVVMRNTVDMEESGVTIHNPWTASLTQIPTSNAGSSQRFKKVFESVELYFINNAQHVAKVSLIQFFTSRKG